MDYTYDHYYDFSKIPNFREMNEVFAGIFDRSVKYYIRNRDGYDQTFALRKIVEFVRDLEKSLIGLINLGYVTTSNIELIKREYKSLDTIGLLESSFRGGIYGISYSKRIEFNPNLSGSRTLSNSERTLLYVCHEMGHRFHEGWKEPKYINKVKILDNIEIAKRIENVSTGIDITKDTFIIYLSGIDTRSNKLPAKSLSDANIILVINPIYKKILMINTPRDYYINLHEINSKTKKT